MKADLPHSIGIAIVSPSGYAPDSLTVQRAVTLLQRQGVRVKNYCDQALKYQRFGAPDEVRVAQLHAAAADPEVQIVLALRGGYGLSRLLPALDMEQLARSGKLFVGHSDFTVLQMALLAHAGTVTFAGPMICDDFGREQAREWTMQQFWNCLRGPAHTVAVQAGGNPVSDVSGRLWGGNLTMLAHLAGTQWMPAIVDGILFVEDVNEHPYRVERMLLQLLHAGVLSRQKALLLGDFSGYRLTEYDNGYGFDSMLQWLRQTLPIPVITGLPFGHTPDKTTLAVGARAELSSDPEGFVLRMSGYPVLST